MGVHMSSESFGRGSFHEAIRQPPSSSADRKTDWGPLQAEARRLLPNEPEPFVIGAIQMLRFSGQAVTAEAVMGRLRAQGRTRAQLDGQEAA